MNTLLLILLASQSWGMDVTCPPVVEGSIDTPKLATDSVTTPKILTGAVDTRTIGTDAVTASKVLNATLTGTKMAPLTIDSSKLGALSVDSEKLAAGSVQKVALGDGAVETSKLAVDAVTSAKLLNGAVETGKLHAQALLDITKSALVSSLDVGSSGSAGSLRVMGGATPILVTNTDYDPGTTTGSSLRIRFGNTAGNTYSDIQAIQAGGSAVAELALNPGGGNVNIAGSLSGVAASGGLGIAGAFTVNVGSTTIAPGGTDTGKLQIGGAGNAACLMLGDTDNAGCTECVALNGVLTCGIDADCVCDGTP